jgi:hypothetical protein
MAIQYSATYFSQPIILVILQSHGQADVSRNVVNSAHGSADTSRNLYAIFSAIAFSNNKSLTLTLNPGVRTDTFIAETFNRYTIQNRINIIIKNFEQDFIIYGDNHIEKPAIPFDSMVKRSVQTINGYYDIEVMVDKPIWMDYSELPAGILNQPTSPLATQAYASFMFSLACSRLGKSYVMQFQDWLGPNITGLEPTFRDVLSHFFDWTSQVPHKQINIFQRGNVVYAVQRGTETAVVDLPYFNESVQVNHKYMNLIKSVTDTNNNVLYGNYVSAVPDDTIISGLYYFGTTQVNYDNGVVTYEQHPSGTGTESTTWSFTGTPGQPGCKTSQKYTAHSDGSATVTYYTYGTDLVGKSILVNETEYTGKSLVVSGESVSGIDTTRITTYYPMGMGLYATIVEENGSVVSGNIGQGNAAPQVSQFSLRQWEKPSNAQLQAAGRFKGGGSFPCDLHMLQVIFGWLEWINGKTEERVNLTIVEPLDRDFVYPNLIDFTNRYTWRGNEYYLERNSVTVTSEKLVQKIELVRWI